MLMMANTVPENTTEETICYEPQSRDESERLMQQLLNGVILTDIPSPEDDESTALRYTSEAAKQELETKSSMAASAGRLENWHDTPLL